MKTKILKIIGHSIYYTKDNYISFRNTNFPHIEHFKFKTHADIFWEVEIKKYDSIDKKLHVNIIDYKSKKIEEFNKQKKKNNVLYNIFFDSPLWNELEPLFMYYRKNSFSGIVDDKTLNTDLDYISQSIDYENLIQDKKPNKNPVTRNQEIISEEFYTTIHFKDANFLEGSVKFNFYVKELFKKIEFEIINVQIKKEYDYIKYHFQKVFKRKTFEVFGTKNSISHKVEFENISSPQISQINENVIEEIKQIEYAKIKKITPKDSSKKLLNINEVFDELDIDLKSGFFKENEQDLINFFLKEKNIKNKHQLVYLSGLKQSSLNKIKFSFKPNFGFLFTIKGIQKVHYCWELLNSHATYLWSIPYDLDNAIQIIEDNIKLTTKIGRQNYKKEINKGNSTLPSTVVFNLIRHNNNKDGFNKWKNELNSLTI